MKIALGTDAGGSDWKELNEALASPEIVNDSANYQKTAKAQGELVPIVDKYQDYKKVHDGIRDDLTRYARPVTGAYYFVPSTTSLRRWRGRRCVRQSAAERGRGGGFGNSVRKRAGDADDRLHAADSSWRPVLPRMDKTSHRPADVE